MQRWNSRYRFAWTPIITFGTRRLAFLEWVEENLDPLAFNESPERVGVAVGDPRIRLTITSRGMTLEDGAADEAWTSKISPAVAGVFEVMEPRDVSMTSAAVAWSHPLPEAGYLETRRAFARRISCIPADAPVAPRDASVLMDVDAPNAEMQVEWGVVEADELLERVTTPDVGRIGASGGRAETKISATEFPLAPVSVFIDSLIHRYDVPQEVPNAEAVLAVIAEADALSATLAHELAKGWTREGGVQK